MSISLPDVDLPGLSGPRAPGAARPYSFPIVASIAPVIGSVAIWAVTQSAFALVFAFLGPLVAIGSLVDARIQARRRRRTEADRFTKELIATRLAIDDRHRLEREQLERASPGSSRLDLQPPEDPERWRADPASGVIVRIGLGTAKSSLRIDGLPATRPPTEDEVSHEFEKLRLYAAMVGGIPVLADARLGIGICGPPAVAAAAARGILLQVANLLPPDRTTIELPRDAAVEWMRALPHANTPPIARAAGITGTAGVSIVRWSAPGAALTVAVAERIESLPVECRVVVCVAGGSSAAIIRHPDSTIPSAIIPDFVSAEQSIIRAESLCRAAAQRGIVPATSSAAMDGEFVDLPVPQPPSDAASLVCAFGWSVTGSLVVDLVADGPHAIVGGMTGSGKSELLVSWVVAMAAAHPPTAVNFLLVDFKGGSSFAPIHSLPHVVGVVTDLDTRAAHRAMLSLRAELRHRERTIAEVGARDIDDHRVTLPRLVIVVDEFAAMASDFPELHELFADLASRGRSLGLHLILCTQRPTGAIRDAVLANAGLRLSLRVNNRADSVAVLGVAVAADLSADRPGSAYLCVGGDDPIPFRIARPSEADIARVVTECASFRGTPRRPWCDDLPRLVRLDSIVARAGDQDGALSGDEAIPFGLVDRPDEQRQQTAFYAPQLDGSLLVIGGQRSGKSELLSTLTAAPGVSRLPSTVEGSWDVVTALVHGAQISPARPRLLVIDDLDSLLGRFPDEYAGAFVDRLVELARDGASAGMALVISMRRIPSALQNLAALCDSRVILQLPSRQDHLMAGGRADTYSSAGSPGSGQWRDSRLQVALADHPTVPAGSAGSAGLVGSVGSVGSVVGRPNEQFSQSLDRASDPVILVVSRRPAEFARRYRASRPECAEIIPLVAGRTVSMPNIVDGSLALHIGSPVAQTIVAGDPDAWHAQWALLTALRPRALILFDRCTVADFRALSGRRELPPPISRGSDACWALASDGSISRVSVFAPG